MVGGKFYKKGKNAKSTMQVKQIQGIVKKSINRATELKRYQIPAQTDTCDSTGAVRQLAPISQGDGEAERIGAMIRYKNLRIKGVISNGNNTVNNIARIIIVKSKDGTAPTLATLLLGTTVYAEQLDDGMNNFKILSDKRFTFMTNRTVNCLYSAKVKIDCPAQYNAAGTQTKNSLYLVTLGNTAAGATASALSCSYDMTFTDM